VTRLSIFDISHSEALRIAHKAGGSSMSAALVRLVNSVAEYEGSNPGRSIVFTVPEFGLTSLDHSSRRFGVSRGSTGELAGVE
jgi:hypothetical protein